MLETLDMLLGIGVVWLTIAISVRIYAKIRPGKIISVKAIVILGTLLFVTALLTYVVNTVCAGLLHSACAGSKALAAFPLLIMGLFVAPTGVLSVYRWYLMSRLRQQSASGGPDVRRTFHPPAVANWMTVMLSVAAVVVLSGRAGLWPPIMYLVANGYSQESVRLLLDLGFSPETADVCGRKPLLFAALTRNGSLVQLLLEYGTDPNQTDSYDTFSRPPLWLAALNGDLWTAELLIEKGAKVDGIGTGLPLVIACNKGHMEMVRLLVAKGAQVNSRDVGGTPISAAAEAKRTDIMQFLIEKGADYYGKDLRPN